MSFAAANHFVVRGAGFEGTVETSSITGDPVVSLTVDGRELQAPCLEVTREGVVVGGSTRWSPTTTPSRPSSPSPR
jgi:hypothetical protein